LARESRSSNRCKLQELIFRWLEALKSAQGSVQSLELDQDGLVLAGCFTVLEPNSVSMLKRPYLIDSGQIMKLLRFERCVLLGIRWRLGQGVCQQRESLRLRIQRVLPYLYTLLWLLQRKLRNLFVRPRPKRDTRLIGVALNRCLSGACRILSRKRAQLATELRESEINEVREENM
jgi:hypothetical protein